MSFDISDLILAVIVGIFIGMFIELQVTKPLIATLTTCNDNLKKYIMELIDERR